MAISGRIVLEEAKWIKVAAGMFGNEKILMIESLPEADSIIVIWFKLLCLAGKQNNSGVFLMGRTPYTEEMFATVFKRPLETVKLALQIFEDFGMIEIINGTVTIPNWEKYQNLDGLDEMREKTRQRVAKHREKQRALASSVTSNDVSNVTVTLRNGVDKKREEKKRGDIAVVNLLETTATTAAAQIIKDWGNGVIRLTDTEREDLFKKLGADHFKTYINKLASFITGKGASVSNHYGTVLKWYEEDKAKGKVKNRYGSFDANDAMQRAIDRSYRKDTNDDE